MLARSPLAQFCATRGSPNMRQFGTKSTSLGHLREWVSYFPRNIAAGKKIISLGPRSSSGSTDHDDTLDFTGGNNGHPHSPAAPFAGPALARRVFAGLVGGRRRGDLHRSRRRGRVPARALVKMRCLAV